ncbi:MAG TPA: hypothetical protein VFZ22_01880 [Pyrinomonadaceae bacterium]|nr:hypothetical protein [Pyrinomonadaceae bacterium]
MKNIRHDIDDLRPEYKRSDFGEMVTGKYALIRIELSEFVRLLIACIGEDEGMTFTLRSPGDQLAHKAGDWTYEIDNANQITLRYWLSGFRSIEDVISNPPPYVTTPQERTDLQNLLTEHVRALKARVAAL